MHIEVRVPGSCGEIAQGYRDGRPFMITCPIARFARAVITDRDNVMHGLGYKAQAALRKTLELYGIKTFPFGIKLGSQLPVGKGMASSSADVVAVIIGAAAALNRELSMKEVAGIAAAVEPTDGIFYPGLANMNYMTGELNKSYATPQGMIFVMFDTGGIVDTLAFHAKHDGYQHADSTEELLAAIDELDQGVSAERIARISTLSAIANQQIIEKPRLKEIINFVIRHGAIGVNAAHSGTMLGVIYHPDTSLLKVKQDIRVISDAFPELKYFATEHLISGGYKIKRL